MVKLLVVTISNLDEKPIFDSLLKWMQPFSYWTLCGE